MRKLAMVLISVLAVCVLLTGCGGENDSEKMCRMEIISEEDQTVVKTLENITWAEAAEFLDVDHEMDISGFNIDISILSGAYNEASDNDISEDELVPEYSIILYQEKTETLIKSGDNDEYDKIMEYVTYKDSPFIKTMIGSDAIKGGGISGDFLTIYYNGTDKFFENLNKVLNSDV